MTQVQIAIPIARDFTSLYLYGKGKGADQGTQTQRGMIFTWLRPHASLRRLACLGLDICGTNRWEQMLSRTPETVARAFTQGEMQWANARPERLAKMWAIKEAITKALGCGFAGLAYQDIVVELASPCPIIRLPATIPTDLPKELEISDLSWQLILFGDPTLAGALVYAWKNQSDLVESHATRDCGRLSSCVGGFSADLPIWDRKSTGKPPMRDELTTSRIVLELRSISGAQRSTRREKRSAEQLEARLAAYSAASCLLPLSTCCLLDIRKTQRGRPLLQITERDLEATDEICLSLSHCSGWAAAALGGFSR